MTVMPAIRNDYSLALTLSIDFFDLMCRDQPRSGEKPPLYSFAAVADGFILSIHDAHSLMPLSASSLSLSLFSLSHLPSSTCSKFSCSPIYI